MSLWVAIAMCLGGVAFGFALARLAPWDRFAAAPTGPATESRAPADAGGPGPVAPAASPGTGARPGAPALPGARPAPEKKRATVRHAAAPAPERKAGMGILDVSAPDGAEIWLDGRRIGAGNLRKPIREGSHRVEVRHGGATVGESFQVAPGETWTYVVTPR